MIKGVHSTLDLHSCPYHGVFRAFINPLSLPNSPSSPTTYLNPNKCTPTLPPAPPPPPSPAPSKPSNTPLGKANIPSPFDRTISGNTTKGLLSLFASAKTLPNVTPCPGCPALLGTLPALHTALKADRELNLISGASVKDENNGKERLAK